MRSVESDCVGCPPDMGCTGSSCRYYRVLRYYCDECGEEADLYYFEGQELCINCIEKLLEKVEGEEF